MLIDQIKFLQKIILFLAEQRYIEEVVDTDMESSVIGDGPDFDYKTKKEWIEDTIVFWFNEVKEKFNIKDNEIKPPENEDKFDPTNTNNVKASFYGLAIGESYELNNFDKIIRVPGGWIFKSTASSSFIPLINTIR